MGEQVERFERRRRLLEVHTDGGHVVLNRDVVSSGVRRSLRPPHGRGRMSLQPAIGSTSCKTRERLIGGDRAPNRAAVRARVSFPSRCSLSFREEHQTRHDDSQRGYDLSDRG